jgi:hypothetical protein
MNAQHHRSEDQMKKMFAVSFVLAAVLAVGCSKKNPQTTPPTGDTKTEMKKEGDAMGGASYGGAPNPCAEPKDPCAAPK